MSRIKTHYILSPSKRVNDNKAARRAIEAVQEVVRVASRGNTTKVDRARAAYIKEIDDAVNKFSSSN